MKKINIIGTCGSGKSTFGKKLAAKINAPYIELDLLFWKPNWTWTEDEEFFEKIKKELSVDTWVLDGNYTRSQPIKWESVDTVIWIDLPFLLNFYQVLKRVFIRAFSKKELWPGTGNVETLGKAFFTRDSILWWMLKTYKKNKVKYEKVFQDEQYSHINFIRLSSRREIQNFLEGTNQESKSL